MNLSNVTNEKADLRKRCYARRIAIDADAALKAAQTVAESVGDAIDVADGTVVSAYWPLKGELDPRPALALLTERGAAPALPRTVGRQRALDFHRWRPEDPLVEGAFKVMEPAAGAETVTPSILLVPLLAFDGACRRLGYGQGHFDRSLQGLRTANPGTLAIGVAFAAQEVDHVPTDKFDQTLDMVITETAVHRAA